MFVRVFDKKNNTYYKSMVYSTLGVGWFLQYLVLNPATDAFELVDYLDKSQENAKPLVETIQLESEDFKLYQGAELLKYKSFCKEKGIEYTDVKQMRGYADVCENYAFLAELLRSRSVPVKDYNISLRQPKDAAEWNYVLTQEDADSFMEKFAGFHDSTLEKISYSENNETAQVNAVFDNTGWYGVAELCFEGVQMLKIMPAGSNCSREIFDASLIVENESVFWADSYMEKADLSYEGSIIQALSLKWRRI